MLKTNAYALMIYWSLAMLLENVSVTHQAAWPHSFIKQPLLMTNVCAMVLICSTLLKQVVLALLVMMLLKLIVNVKMDGTGMNLILHNAS